MKKWGVLFIVLFGMTGAPNAVTAEETPVRIGWQTSWATQGQMAAVLMKTDILKANGLRGEFKGFSYGGPLNEGALANEVDVIFTADQPACMLLARGAQWTIIGRLIYNRVATIAPARSSVATVKDLKGKIVGIPFGAAAHRETLRALTEAGLTPGKDVTVRNIGIYEEVNVIQAGTDSAWGEFAAFATWDPPLAELETAGKAKVLDRGLVTSVIVMSNAYIRAHPDAPARFLKAYQEAFFYYAQHRKQADEWFVQESKLSFAPEVLTLAASVEPNLSAQTLSAVDISLSERDISAIQRGADFMFEQKLTETAITDVRSYINLSFLEETKRQIDLKEGATRAHADAHN